MLYQNRYWHTDYISILSGIRQGCILSPLLSLMTIDFVMRRSMHDPAFGIKWTNSTTLTDLDFADDLALLGDSAQNLQMI